MLLNRQYFGFSLRTILAGVAVLVVCFAGTLWAIDALSPGGSHTDRRPTLTALPSLQPVTRTSVVIAPVAVLNNAIRDTLDAAAPRNLAGKRDNPLSELLGKADIGWTLTRGAMGIAGTQTGLAITTPINGSLRVTGQIANQAGNVAGAITGLLGDSLGRNVQGLATRALDQRADIRGNVTVLARPALQPNWRIEPNLTGNVALADGGLTIAGIRINVSNEVKPLLDRTVGEQIGQLSNRLRNDPTLERTARREWAKMCRSIALGATAPGAPNLWLEVRPTQAFAAQPRVLADWVVLTLGVQAETRILPSETKPDCPFPARLELVPPMDQGKVGIGVPIDVPFTELSRVLTLQLKDKTFPDDRSAPGKVTVQAVNVAASGERLLVSLRVKAHETKSWFGFGADATVHVWGKPVLDRERQMLRLTDVSLDVESGAALGLVGAAARAALPYLQSALAENAVIDLKPFASSAQKSIEAALTDFQSQTDGVQVEAAVTDLRLAGIEFDSTALRVIAEADGTARALVTKLGP